MRKIYAVNLAVILLFSSGVFATGYMGRGGIGQTEDFGLYGETYVSQMGSPGSAVGGNMSSVEQDQSLMKIFNVKLRQYENTMLTQNANASGLCGSFSVFESGNAAGDQSQLISQKGPRRNFANQNEALGVTLVQNAEKDGGIGTAGGVQCLISEQGQSLMGNGIKMNESQSIGVAQYADVSGTAWSDAQATNYVNITADQSQTVR